MCLNLKYDQKRDEAGNPIPSTAKRDITVYKHLTYNINLRKYITPLRGVPVNIGSRGTRMKASLTTNFSQSSIEEGIHAYTNKKDACREVRFYRKGTVVEAIIPKGSKYFKSDDGEIVSTELKLGKIIFKCKN